MKAKIVDQLGDYAITENGVPYELDTQKPLEPLMGKGTENPVYKVLSDETFHSEIKKKHVRIWRRLDKKLLITLYQKSKAETIEIGEAPETKSETKPSVSPETPEKSSETVGSMDEFVEDLEKSLQMNMKQRETVKQDETLKNEPGDIKKGKKSDETKKRETKSVSKKPEKTKNETGGVSINGVSYKSMREASEKTGESTATISRKVARGDKGYIKN